MSLVSSWRPTNTHSCTHTLSFTVSPLSICLSSVTVLSFAVILFSLISHLPSSVSQTYVILLPFHSSFFVSTLSPPCLFSFHPFTPPPPFFLPPVLPVLSPVLFKSNFLLYSMKGTTVFLYLQQTDCIAASPVHWSL